MPVKTPRYTNLRNHFLVLLYSFAGVALPRDDGLGGAKTERYGVCENDRIGDIDGASGTWVCKDFPMQRAQMLRPSRPGEDIDYSDKGSD